MVELTGGDKAVDRRGFLRGSALFAAAAVGLSVAGPAFAQQAPAPAKPEEKKPEEKKPGEPAGETKKEEPAKPAGQAERDPNKLYDKNGREYRVCERCGGNMYQEGDTWTCEQCGLSYVE